MQEKLTLETVWTIKKYRSKEDYEKGIPFEISRFTDNKFLVEGMNAMWALTCGQSGVTPFDATNARIGVGDSTVAEDENQTGLLGTNIAYKGMDSGYPSLGTKKAIFRSTFGPDEANFAWNEFTVANGPGNAYVNLNRKVSPQGTKLSGQTWELTVELSLANP